VLPFFVDVQFAKHLKFIISVYSCKHWLTSIPALCGCFEWWKFPMIALTGTGRSAQE